MLRKSLSFLLMVLLTALVAAPIRAATPMESSSIPSFLMQAYEVRTRAIWENRTDLLTQLYHPSRQALINHENHRLQVWRGLEKAWGAKFTGLKGQAAITSYEVVGDHARARVYEWVDINWTLLGKSEQSGAGIWHDVTLAKLNGRWVIELDAYDEGPALTTSPDYIKPADVSTLRPVTTTSQVVPQPVTPTGGISIMSLNRAGVTAYADRWVNPITQGTNNESAYNPAYFNYNSVGGDCANFVSQSLYEGGGYTMTSTWTYTFHSPPTQGDATDTWVSASMLRDFLISSGRGIDYGNTGTPVAIGDTVHYDWTSNGSIDHVTIVVAFDASGRALIDSHNNDYKHWPWNYGATATRWVVHNN